MPSTTSITLMARRSPVPWISAHRLPKSPCWRSCPTDERTGYRKTYQIRNNELFERAVLRTEQDQEAHAVRCTVNTQDNPSARMDFQLPSHVSPNQGGHPQRKQCAPRTDHDLTHQIIRSSINISSTIYPVSAVTRYCAESVYNVYSRSRCG